MTQARTTYLYDVSMLRLKVAVCLDLLLDPQEGCPQRSPPPSACRWQAAPLTAQSLCPKSCMGQSHTHQRYWKKRRMLTKWYQGRHMPAMSTKDPRLLCICHSLTTGRGEWSCISSFGAVRVHCDAHIKLFDNYFILYDAKKDSAVK